MINSRSIDDLLPTVAAQAREHIARCHALGIDLLVTSTFRDSESQNVLYAQGRTVKGAIVTNARGGQSSHQYRIAYDVVALRNGKPVWGTFGEDGKLWQSIGKIGKECGLEWAGEWKTFKEFPHFQNLGGLTLADLQAGKRPFA
jgi:peptidoglycan LD-endopeptidase CwlK